MAHNAQSAAVETLEQSATPNEWKDWLIEIQNQLISQGYCQGLTETGSAEFAERFTALQTFFTEIRDN